MSDGGQGRSRFADELRVSPPTRTMYVSAADFFTAVKDKAAVCCIDVASSGSPPSAAAAFSLEALARTR